MKKIYGLAALAAAMTLASCSNDNEPVNNGNVTTELSKGYITVSLATPASSVTRADDVYQEGEEEANAAQGTVAESVVNQALIITFVDGAVHDIVEFTPKPWYSSTDDNIDKVSEGNIIEVTVPTETTGEGASAVTTDKKIEEFITVLNVSKNDLGNLKGKDKDVVRRALADYSSTSNGIMMSTSAYKDATNAVVYTTKVGDKIFKDPAEAAKSDNLIKVFVERGVARIDYNFIEKFDNQGGGAIKFNDKMTDETSVDNITITITGVDIANVADKTPLVKNIDGYVAATSTWPSFAGGFDVNPSGKYRSHWADAAPIRDSKASEAEGIWLDNKSYTTMATLANGIEGFTKKSQYVQENTTDQNTCVILTAQLGNENKDIFRFVANGKYYLGEDNIKTAALGYLELDGYYKKDANDHYVSLTKDDLTIVPGDHGYDGYIQFDASLKGKLYKENGLDANNQMKFDPVQGEGTTDEEKNAAGLANANKALRDAKTKDKSTEELTLEKYRVYKWANGKCYYFTEIKPTVVGAAGVVRNHIYNLNLKSVAGLGVPVFNPSDIIIPEIPDKVDPKEPDNYYVRASINILEWTYYSQDVDFKTDWEK